MPNVGVIDYGVGNLGSLLNILRKVGAQARLVSNSEELDHFDRLLLPGVGAFDAGISQLRQSGIVPALEDQVLHRKKPILGICLGAQLLGHSSAEGQLPGLGWINMKCRRFELSQYPDLRVPHMAWNDVTPTREDPLFSGFDREPRFYFVHSYFMECGNPADVLATTEYGHTFVSAVRSGSIVGVQFHPEKSHRFGMALLRNFIFS